MNIHVTDKTVDMTSGFIPLVANGLVTNKQMP